MSKLNAYRNDIVLLYVEDRLSVALIAQRYGVSAEPVRLLLIAEGVQMRDAATAAREWRQSAAGRERTASQAGKWPVPDENEILRLQRDHVSAVIHALGGRGFPYLTFGARA